jgi:hypothetical protein
MLPGFRFLFAAIVFAMSILVFGLGAAALLRAAHEEFANIPSRRAPPEPVFAKQNDAPVPTLALLRFDPPVADKTLDDALPAVIPETVAPETVAPAEQTADAAPTESEKLAALKPEDSVPAEGVKPDAPAPETATTAIATPTDPAESEARVPAGEMKVAAIAETPPPVTAIAPTAPEPAAEVPSLETNIAATRIATLGGPEVTIEETRSAKAAADTKADQASRKRAQRAKERRRIARRARLAREAAAAAALQLQANPFAPVLVARTR